MIEAQDTNAVAEVLVPIEKPKRVNRAKVEGPDPKQLLKQVQAERDMLADQNKRLMHELNARNEELNKLKSERHTTFSTIAAAIHIIQQQL